MGRLTTLRVLLALNIILASAAVGLHKSAGAQVVYPPCCKADTEGNPRCCANCCILNPPQCEDNGDCSVKVE